MKFLILCLRPKIVISDFLCEIIPNTFVLDECDLDLVTGTGSTIVVDAWGTAVAETLFRLEREGFFADFSKKNLGIYLSV